MSKRPSLLRLQRSLIVVAPALAVSSALIFAACGGSDATIGEPDQDASTKETSSSTPTTDSASPIDDAATSEDSGQDLDAGTITDGGDLPDASVDDAGDAGDAGAMCGTLTPGATVDSTCSSAESFFLGGILVNKTYSLERVTVLGNDKFCANQFKTYEERGQLVVTTSQAATTFRFLEEFRVKGVDTRFAQKRWDVDVERPTLNGLTFTPRSACPGKEPPPAKAQYNIAVGKGGASILTLRLPYGAAGQADYRFVAP